MSDTRTILLIGAAGQVGRALRRDLAPLGSMIALDLPELDITDSARLSALILAQKPAILVNAAAYTAVDKAESDPHAAQAVNAAAVGTMAAACRQTGTFMVHYSTEYVFDGLGDRPYRPEDAPNPLSVYGRTKLAGEQALLAAAPAALILRTSWVFGLHGGNFVKTILRLARTRDELRIVADQIGQPTPAELVSSVTALILYRMIAQGMPLHRPATYHLAASRPVTWHQFACTILEQAHALGFDLKASARNVVPITTLEYPLPAKRPANSRLDVSALEQAFDLRMPDWLPYLTRMLEDLKRGEAG